MNGLIDILVANIDVISVNYMMEDILQSVYKDVYLTHFVKDGLYLEILGAKLEETSLTKLDT